MRHDLNYLKEGARRMGNAPASRVSFHLCRLEAAGLIASRRNGRSIIHNAVFPALSDLVALLMRDCCDGHCEFCGRAIALFFQCTGPPADKARKGRAVIDLAAVSILPGMDWDGRP
jgi:hypothetical protein